MKRILTAIVVAAMVLVPWKIVLAAPVPWQTFSEMTPDVEGSKTVQCPQGEVFMLKANKNGAVYLVAYSPDSGVMAMVYDPNPKDPEKLPTELGIGHVDPKNTDVIPVLVWRPFVESDNPCANLFSEPA